MTPVSIVVWLWKGNRAYTPEHVNVCAKMFRRHLSIPHRFICITDQLEGFSDDVNVLPIPMAAENLGLLRTPENPNFPSCYRRLWMFSEEAKVLGDRVLMVDVDLVLTDNIDHFFENDALFVGWQPIASWGGTERLGGGMYLLTTGSQTHVYNDFNGRKSIIEARNAGFRGSDQAWISYKLAGRCPVFPADSGIYSVRDFNDGRNPLPVNACLIHFNGHRKPWDGHLHWLAQHWC
jgi:hypothetical protein